MIIYLKGGLNFHMWFLLFRYTNIIPFDHNRVQLHTPINGTDYINASNITGINADLLASRESRYKDTAIKLNNPPNFKSESNPARFSNINFIASQGPLPNTCVHHLQMIFEQKVDFVIMLTRCEERAAKDGEKKGIEWLLFFNFIYIHKNTILISDSFTVIQRFCFEI